MGIARLWLGGVLVMLAVVGAGAQSRQEPGSPGKVIKSEKDDAEMVLVPAGEFWMGSDEYDGEKPRRRVHLDAFSYRRSPERNPPGPDSGSARVLRGGDWYDDPISLRASNRGGVSASGSVARGALSFES